MSVWKRAQKKSFVFEVLATFSSNNFLLQPAPRLRVSNELDRGSTDMYMYRDYIGA